MNDRLNQFRKTLEEEIKAAEVSLADAIPVVAYALLQAEAAIVGALKARKLAIEVAE